MLGNEPTLQTHVKILSGSLAYKLRSKSCLFGDGFQLDKTMRDAETIGLEFFPPSVNAGYDYDTSRITWQGIVNVSKTIEIKSLMPRGPKKFSG